MADTVFFSWQADTPTRIGRNFIERALERALGQLQKHLAVEEPERESPILDRDTKGVAGQPPIVDTIFRKIDATTAFVPDLTFVGNRLDGRPTPNPNVLIEYGWALKALGHGRIVPVMNVAFGKPDGDNMPFDMRHLRHPIAYHLTEDMSDDEVKAAREGLVKALFEALKVVLECKGLRSDGAEAGPPPYEPVSSVEGRPSRFRLPNMPIGLRVSEFNEPSDIILEDDPAVWLRVMPVTDPGRRWNAVKLRKAATGTGLLLTPLIVHGGTSELRAEDGIGNFVVGQNPSLTKSVVFAFERGEVWAIDGWIIGCAKKVAAKGALPMLPMHKLEPDLPNALRNYQSYLKNLGIAGPFRWMAGIEGIKGFSLYHRPPPGIKWYDPHSPQGTCVADQVTADGTIDPGQDARVALKPFFEQLFLKCGLERPSYLDDPQ